MYPNYASDRKFIDRACNQIFGRTLDFNDSVLPQKIPANEDTCQPPHSFRKNNSIVLRGLFFTVLKEKVRIDLLIGKLGSKLKRNFETYLREYQRKITVMVNGLSSMNYGMMIYSKMFELQNLFEEEVIKKIIPEIITEIKGNAVLKREFNEDELIQYSQHPTAGVPSILVSKVVTRDELIQAYNNNLSTILKT